MVLSREVRETIILGRRVQKILCKFDGFRYFSVEYHRRRHDDVVDDVAADNDEYEIIDGHFRVLRQKLCLYAKTLVQV